MRRLNFLHTLANDYDKIDETVIELKSGVIGLCADIERFFQCNLGVSLIEKTPIAIHDKFIKIFPNFANITSLQLEQLQDVFCKIRTVNCSLYLSRSINIPNELQEYFNTFPTPQYDITINGELTVYGMIYVLAFLSQKYQISAFIVTYCQTKYFFNFSKRETSETQNALLRSLCKLCGKGKSNFTFKEPFDKTDVQTFNDSYKSYVTKIFLGIEKCILKWSLSSKKNISFNYLLSCNEPFSKNHLLASALIKLRNYWFRGITLFDEITENDKTVVFSLEYFISTIIKLKRFLSNYEDYAYVLQLITQLGEKLVHFFLIRMVEESYKILDKRLLTEDKVQSKIETLNKLVLRFKSVHPTYFEKIIQLIDKEEISYFVNASRFPDLYPREMQSNHLKIIHIKSDAPIQIGEFTSNYKELSFVLVDVDDEYINAINGVSPFKMHLETEEYYSSKIGVYNATV